MVGSVVRTGITKAALALAGGWFVALVARRRMLQMVRSRSVGAAAPTPSLPAARDIGDGLWRGPAPTPQAYEELARSGVTDIVDLRAEADLTVLHPLLAATGLGLLHLPIVNGRSPTPAHLARLRETHESAMGTCYVHCEAGEGRTGAILGAYFVAQGHPVRDVLSDALAVGDLTFSQMVYVASAGRSRCLVTAVDWTIDRPTETLVGLLAR